MELPQRKQVKLEQEPEEVSTVTSGKVVVSSLGSARIIGRKHQLTARKKSGHKSLAKTRTGELAKKKSAVLKKQDSSNIDVVKQKKATNQSGKSSLSKAASKSSKRSAIQQPPRKKKRSA